MTFLYPSMLWAMAAVALPWLIHLFNLRRRQKVYFSRLAFLQEIDTRTKNMRRLQEILLLLSRMLFVACLVVAFAQPVLLREGAAVAAEQNNTTYSLYIDNSYSMQQPAPNGIALLGQAKQYADEWARALPAEARFQLLSGAFESNEARLMGKSEVSSALALLDYSLYRRRLSDVLSRQERLVARHNTAARANLMLFSDFQENIANTLLEYPFKSDYQYHFIQLKAQEQLPNVSIDSVWLASPFVRTDASNKLFFRLKNHGKQPVRELAVQLFLQNEAVAGSSVQIEPQSSQTFSMEFNAAAKGWQQAHLHIEDHPISFDNDYYFSYNASRHIRLLFLHEDKQTNTYVESAYRTEPTIEWQARRIGQLELSDVEAADLIVLEIGANTLEGEPLAWLQAFVRNGGSLCLLPTSDAKKPPAYINTWGVEAESFVGAPTDSSLVIQVQSLQHPFFEGVFEKYNFNVLMPYARPLWVLRRGEDILSLRNGLPFLMRYRQGAGKVYVFASPLSPSYTNVVKHGIFVPTLLRMAQFAPAQAAIMAFRSNVRNLLLPLQAYNKQEYPFVLRRNEQEWLVGAQKLGSRYRLELPTEAMQPGFYTLLSGTDTIAVLAFNTPAEESELTCLPSMQLQALADSLPNVHYYSGTDNRAAIQAYRSTFLALPLWKYFVGAALLFLLLETLIIRLWK